MIGLSGKFQESRDHEVEIWPETLPAINLFTAALTQWRTGPNGLIGLDYVALDLLMDYDGTPMAERRGLLDDVQCIERGYLQAIRQKQ